MTNQNNDQQNLENDPKKLKDLVDELQEKVASLEKELAGKDADWKRALADYRNLERRILAEKDEAVRFANLILIAELLPILDNLEALKEHVEDKGLQMVANQVMEVLQGAGLEKIETLGRDFDSSCMEAVDTEESEDNKGKVLEEVTTGYRFKDKLVRPAKVVVGK